MFTDHERASAKVYAFPDRRPQLSARRNAQPAIQGPVQVERASAGAWYHEAAIRDAERPKS